MNVREATEIERQQTASSEIAKTRVSTLSFLDKIHDKLNEQSKGTSNGNEKIRWDHATECDSSEEIDAREMNEIDERQPNEIDERQPNEINDWQQNGIIERQINDIHLQTKDRFHHPVNNASHAKSDSQLYAKVNAAYDPEGIYAGECISREDMTMQEYKEYICIKIFLMRRHPSRSKDLIIVQITDEGFERMKNDAEYERWVLETLRRDFAVANPWGERCGGSIIIHHFGAREEEYQTKCWNNDVQRSRSRCKKIAQKEYLERLMVRKKRRKELLEAKWKKEAMYKRLDEKARLTWENFVDFLEGEVDIFLSMR